MTDEELKSADDDLLSVATQRRLRVAAYERGLREGRERLWKNRALSFIAGALAVWFFYEWVSK